jgi:hypothetical protein
MLGKLPFVGRIFWKTLVGVIVFGVVAWVIVLNVSDYEMIPADWGGSIISGIILAYLVHLWLLPEEEDEPVDED